MFSIIQTMLQNELVFDPWDMISHNICYLALLWIHYELLEWNLYDMGFGILRCEILLSIVMDVIPLRFVREINYIVHNTWTLKVFHLNQSSQSSRNNPWHLEGNLKTKLARNIWLIEQATATEILMMSLYPPFMSQAWHFKVTWSSLTLRSDKLDGQCVMIVT